MELMRSYRDSLTVTDCGRENERESSWRALSKLLLSRSRPLSTTVTKENKNKNSAYYFDSPLCFVGKMGTSGVERARERPSPNEGRHSR